MEKVQSEKEQPPLYSSSQAWVVEEKGAIDLASTRSIIPQQQAQQNKQFVRSGDQVCLQHLKTRRYLHSHFKDYEKGSRQQEVVCCNKNGCYENQWEIRKVDIVMAERGQYLSISRTGYEHPLSPHEGEVIMNRDFVVLTHRKTLKNLFVPLGFMSQVTKDQQEVCCVQNLLDFSGSIFQIRYKNDMKIRPVEDNQEVYLCSVQNSYTLHSHQVVFKPNKDFNEVTLYHNRDDNDIWVVQLHQSVAEKFHKPPTLAKISNVLNGSCIRLMHTETISVLAASNRNYKGGSKLREVYGGQIRDKEFGGEDQHKYRSNDVWRVNVVYRAFNKLAIKDVEQEAVLDGDLIYFTNLKTQEVLCSRPGIRAHIATSQQEVHSTTTNQLNQAINANTLFKVILKNSSTNKDQTQGQTDNQVWSTQCDVEFLHIVSNYYLHSHRNISQGKEGFEITCFDSRDENNFWTVEKIYNCM